jgi:hypothetical protein
MVRQQLSHLLSVASLPNVTISVVPFIGAIIPFLNQFVMWELPTESLVTVETYAAELQVRAAEDLVLQP